MPRTFTRRTTPVEVPLPRDRDEKGKFIKPFSKPSDKQLWKWTVQNWGGKDTTVPPFLPNLVPDIDQNIESMKALSGWVRTWNRIVEHTGSSEEKKKIAVRFLRRHKLFYDINDHAVRIANSISNLRNGLAGISPGRETSKPDSKLIAKVFADLLALRATTPMQWDRENKDIRIITEPVTLYDLNDKTLRYQFGRFYIYLPKLGRKPVIQPCTPRAASNSGHLHPFISGGGMCYGSGDRAVAMALKDGDIFSVIDLTLGVLHHYSNKNGPFQVLERWKGVCDERFDPTTGEAKPMDWVPPGPMVAASFHCNQCDGTVSKVEKCRHCGEMACVGCMIKCRYPGCEEWVCHRCAFRCTKCNREERAFCQGHFNGHPDVCDVCSGYAEGVFEEEEIYDEDGLDEDDE